VGLSLMADFARNQYWCLCYGKGRGREEIQLSSCFATSLRKRKSRQRICLVPRTSISLSRHPFELFLRLRKVGRGRKILISPVPGEKRKFALRYGGRSPRSSRENLLVRSGRDRENQFLGRLIGVLWGLCER
jgi:hypothetical protein